MEFTAKALARIAADYQAIAGEPVKVEQIAGTVYVFGSELACHRLGYKMNLPRDRARVAYSDNLESWFFSFEPKF